MDRKDLRILWMSNAPFCPTGYGTVTKNVCYRLLQAGYTVATVNYWGHEGRLLNLNGLRQYPKGFTEFGEDAARFAIEDFKPHVFVTLFDIWVGHGWLDRLHPRWCAYSPVDHTPLMPATADIARNAYRVIAMSRYGYNAFKEAGIASTYIPHGVDTQVYHPLLEKGECKDWTGALSENDPFVENYVKLPFNHDCFVVGCNFANKGDRKDPDRMMRAFKIFLDQNPDAQKDARLYMHTWIRGMPEGFQLNNMAEEIGILPYLRWTPILKMWVGMEENQLNMIYNSFDVFLNLARGEGFGIPIIEAQAAGVPCIVTDFTSMRELVGDHGWLIPIKDFHYTALNAMQAVADEWKAAEAIGKAYNDMDETEKLGDVSRKFAERLYDYDQFVMPLWVDFFDHISGYIAEREILYKVAKKNLRKIKASNPYPVS